MPSGPKKRLRAKRKSQGSPAVDASSDRDTEALSVTGSVDVDDLESGLDTPVKVSSRPSFLDQEAVSSQTDEWVRVSDFDVGTPTSQTEENDPSAEEGDTGGSRRSLDKLNEWETVSGEHEPERQEGSVNSAEEEPSECEAASAHSSESYTNLPSPHLADRVKDGDSSDTDRKNRSTDRPSSSGSSSSRAGEGRAQTFDLSASTDVREEVPAPHDVPSVLPSGDCQVEEIENFNFDLMEEKSVGGAAAETATDVLSGETKLSVDDATPDIDDQWKMVGTSGSRGPVLAEAIPKEESHNQVSGEVLLTFTESALDATNPDEVQTFSANAKEIREVGPRLTSRAGVDLAADEEVLPNSNESLAELGEEESAVAARQADVEGTEGNADVEVASPTVAGSAVAGEKELASTSADAKEEDSKGDAPYSEVAILEKNSFDPHEWLPDSSVKAEPTSGMAVPLALHDATSMEKNGTEKRLIESKSSTGCCGVLYWLLGWDH